ncbi:hypothetical protein A3F03_04290 [Candidatus Roizmanbacteria bacterium RIFCSPHIGHO2_12_FULL_41_11]|uniref:PsbP C-terminal domain-containing protein n=3 Tax=Candidatus Roizmaniibacteriota TaxID=1752723 RepID=A0A1F7JS22_9BACT|nr:MAG: hypothetical protein A3F03_04290 [Candidatus Roizmanbacteria bacterium RIFCSPHIGHO2_12_FULL_41_11]OGK52801.1 MAG: hypothetical protein A2966_04830 [Candidatus Roizmanbacteria bacterium RIFCSPLOWO2_01_FULL_41_22]OGK58422.1 MAG: hypothetical protein A3H86_03590 [Candidatus Roizmanbacteria bacterium RIFCSPLOWO2_02_FULL_41_9]
MNVSRSWTTVTTLSKILAGVLFITLPFLGFYLGMEYEKKITPSFTNSLTPIVENKIPVPPPDPIANWKTYKNSKYGFEFKYPKHLSDNCCGVYSDSLYGMAKVITFAERLDTNFDGGAEVYNGISFLVSSRNINQTLKEYVDDQKIKTLEEFYKDPETLELNLPHVKIMEVTVNGVNGFKIPNFSVLHADTYYLQTEDGKYFIAIMQSEEHTPEFEQIFDQILSTFKFLD